MIDAFAEAIIDGRAGVAAVAVIGWLLEYRRGRDRDRQVTEIARETTAALDGLKGAMQNINTSIALMLDRERR